MDSDPLQDSSNSPSAKDQLAVKAGSDQVEGGYNLNCAQTQQKLDDEGGDETSSQQREQIVSGDRRSLVGAGGGEADDNQRAQQATMSLPASINASAPPIWPVPHPPAFLRTDTEAQKTAWQKASRFCAMWEQAITRLNYLSVCVVSAGDYKAAFNFFSSEPQIGPFFLLGAAIISWRLTDEAQPKGKNWDKLYHARGSKDLQMFVRSFASGKLESEIGRHKVQINAWVDLRFCFTQSEIIFYHWSPTRVPIKGLYENEIWENDPSAPDYYRKRHLPVPPEVIEAETNRQLQKATT